MSIIRKITKPFDKLIMLAQKYAESDKSLLEFIRAIRKARKTDGVSSSFLLNTNYLSKPESYICLQEYFVRGMALNDYAFREALNKKQYLFKRLPEAMNRGYLVVDEATDEEIAAFISKYKKVAGKCNLSAGKGFQRYCSGEAKLPERIRADKVELLEEWIEQHEEYAKINASSVNTLRIHTLRTTEGCQCCLLNQLSIGSSGAIHNMPSDRRPIYDVIVKDTGEIVCTKITLDYKHKLCDKHLDSGYAFRQGAVLPHIQEAVALCKKSAEKIPEFRYLAWDVAFTPKGPVIVEANVLSGAIRTQQIVEFLVHGRGLRAEIEELLAKGMEGIVYDKNCNLRAVAFADLSYFEGDNQPNALQQFLLLLESAVHNHGVEFFNITQENANCSILHIAEANVLSLAKGAAKASLDLPKHIPENIYEADKLARKLAKEVYKTLVALE